MNVTNYSSELWHLNGVNSVGRARRGCPREQASISPTRKSELFCNNGRIRISARRRPGNPSWMRTHCTWDPWKRAHAFTSIISRTRWGRRANRHRNARDYRTYTFVISSYNFPRSIEAQSFYSDSDKPDNTVFHIVHSMLTKWSMRFVTFEKLRESLQEINLQNFRKQLSSIILEYDIIFREAEDFCCRYYLHANLGNFSRKLSRERCQNDLLLAGYLLSVQRAKTIETRRGILCLSYRIVKSSSRTM